MKVLVACEFSGIVRDAFIAAGHDAWSCDLLPSEAPGPHLCCDVRLLLGDPWDLVIAHPPCTYLANSGVRWLHTRPERWPLMRDAAAFFMDCLGANAPSVAVENPVMHGHASIRKPDFTVQPWQFGHGETKRICFWTRGLPPLRSTDVVDGREPRVHQSPPSPDRWKERSRFYPGVAAAMASQWSAARIDLFEEVAR